MDKDKSAHNNLKKKKYYSNKIEGSLENSSTKIRHNNRTTRARERERERERERGGKIKSEKKVIKKPYLSRLWSH